MTIDETYNIHKKLNCVFPFFKSKWLCKHGKHNFQLNTRIVIEVFNPAYLECEEYILFKYDRVKEVIWQCKCCGIIEKI